MKRKGKSPFYWKRNGIIHLAEQICCCGHYDINDRVANGGLILDVRPGLYDIWVKYLIQRMGNELFEVVASVRLVHHETMKDWQFNPDEGVDLGGFCHSNAHFPEVIGKEYSSQADIMIFSCGEEPDIFWEDVNGFRYEADKNGHLQCISRSSIEDLVLKSEALYFREAFGDGDVMFYGVKDDTGLFCAIEAVSVDEGQYREKYLK